MVVVEGDATVNSVLLLGLVMEHPISGWILALGNKSRSSFAPERRRPAPS